MTGEQRILVVVDPTAAEQPAVDRGMMLARELGCTVDLLICHYDARFAGKRMFGGAEREALRKQSLEHQLGYLRSLAREHAQAGVKITIEAAWDTPLAEGIIRECLRREPCFVLKDTHHHSTIARTLFTNTDWQLIRDCPAPLWLVKPGELQRPRILAAVDPMTEHDKPESLDMAILDAASELSGKLRGELHVYHGFDPTPEIARVGALAMTPAPIPVEELTARLRTDHAAKLDELIQAHNLPADHQHLLSGAVAELLPALARKLDAQLVVMGALARNRIQQAVIGSTAERVLEHLPCDLLILKPPGYRSSVTYKAQASDFMTLVERP